MTNDPVVVGVDGSASALAATEWAADEAARRATAHTRLDVLVDAQRSDPVRDA